MGKLAVVFFAVLAIQAAFGGVSRKFGYDREGLKDLMQQVVRVSEDVIETLGNSPITNALVLGNERDLENHDLMWKNREVTWENREFVQEIEEIITRLEEITSTHDEQVNTVTYKVLREMQELRTLLQELIMTNDRTTILRLETLLRNILIKLVKHMETWVQIFEEELTNDVRYTDITTILKKFLMLLRKLHGYNNTYKYRNFDVTNMYTDKLVDRDDSMMDRWTPTENYRMGDIHEIIKELEILMERFHVDNVLVKRSFLHLICEYLDNLREFVVVPELRHNFELFFNKEPNSWSMHELKTNLWTFMKAFMGNMERMPESARIAFWKATHKFLNRMQIMVQINTPIRELVFRMHTLSYYITCGLEILPEHLGHFKHSITQNAREFLTHLERFLIKIQHTDNHHFGNWKRIMSLLENGEWNKHSLIVAIHESTTEMHKLLISLTDNEELALEVITEFLELLNVQKSWIIELGKQIRDVEYWSLLIAAKTNKLSMYFHGDISAEDRTVLFEALRKIMDILGTRGSTHFKECAIRLRRIVEEFETEKYLINTLLQRVELELNRLMWDVTELRRTETLPTELIEVARLYLFAINDIYVRHKVMKGMLMVQTPAEIVIKAESVATRVIKIFHTMVPVLKHTTQFYRGQDFYQMLEIVIFRLRKLHNVVETHDHLLKEVYERLLKIQTNLKHDLERRDNYFRENLAMYIQESFMWLKKLAFEHRSIINGEIVKMYGDFLFGMKTLLNQVQFDIIFMIDDYTIETLNLQIGSTFPSISTLLKRTQMKPELKRVVATQMGVLGQLIKYYPMFLGNVRGMENFAMKYNKMYEELMHIYLVGWNQSIEKLTELLDMCMRTIVLDLHHLSHVVEESVEINELYKYTLVIFHKIFVRLQNVHYFEYYKPTLKKHNFVELIQRLSSNIANKLQHTSVDNKEVLYDLAIQTVKYIHRLEKVAGRLQLESNIYPETFYRIYSELLPIRIDAKITVDQLRTYLARRVMHVASQFERMIMHESRVGTKNALIRYMVAIEKLYVHIDHILSHKHDQPTLLQLTTHADRHVSYLIKALEYVNPDNKIAFKVLEEDYRRVVEFVKVITEQLHGLRKYSDKFEHIYNKISESKIVEFRNVNSINDLKLNIAIYAKHISLILKQLAWVTLDRTEISGRLYHDMVLTSDLPEAKMLVKKLTWDYLLMLQLMQLEIETTILTPQKWHMLIKWGLLKGYHQDTSMLRGLNDVSDKYVDFHGTFMKHTDRFGKKYFGTFEKNFEYQNRWQKGYGIFKKAYGGEYEPRHGFHGFFDKMYHGVFDRDFDNKREWNMDWETTPNTWKYGGYSNMRQLENPGLLYGNDYETNDIWNLVRRIKSIVYEVSEELRNKYDVKQDLTLLVRQLVQILDNIIDRLEQENTNKYEIRHIIKKFKEIKIELEHGWTSGTFNRVAQLNYHLSNALELIVTEIENLTRVVKREEVQIFKDVFIQFLNYIRNVRTHIKNTVFGGDLEGFMSGNKYNSMPWLNLNHGLRTTGTSRLGLW